ncbi:hypothetical protein RHECIAT_CH0001064 [Rhizobium etli CIAT 652]|uniref:Uncharacterized protein n=1 Tax=Rhizobium etli (strain CIAT 652) TaxID=491916 RepID=B3PSC7_RHIE6|nr:hypothetical protein RHECIAT_CH0001064 [Rhizobium etli CIAT 652]
MGPRVKPEDDGGWGDSWSKGSDVQGSQGHPHCPARLPIAANAPNSSISGKTRFAYQPCSPGVILIGSRRLAMAGDISQSTKTNVTAAAAKNKVLVMARHYNFSEIHQWWLAS